MLADAVRLALFEATLAQDLADLDAKLVVGGPCGTREREEDG
jgi:hypothetical protein